MPENKARSFVIAYGVSFVATLAATVGVLYFFLYHPRMAQVDAGNSAAAVAKTEHAKPEPTPAPTKKDSTAKNRDASGVAKDLTHRKALPTRDNKPAKTVSEPPKKRTNTRLNQPKTEPDTSSHPMTSSKDSSNVSGTAGRQDSSTPSEDRKERSRTRGRNMMDDSGVTRSRGSARDN